MSNLQSYSRAPKGRRRTMSEKDKERWLMDQNPSLGSGQYSAGLRGFTPAPFQQPIGGPGERPQQLPPEIQPEIRPEIPVPLGHGQEIQPPRGKQPEQGDSKSQFWDDVDKVYKLFKFLLSSTEAMINEFIAWIHSTVAPAVAEWLKSRFLSAIHSAQFQQFKAFLKAGGEAIANGFIQIWLRFVYGGQHKMDTSPAKPGPGGGNPFGPGSPDPVPKGSPNPIYGEPVGHSARPDYGPVSTGFNTYDPRTFGGADTVHYTTEDQMWATPWVNNPGAYYSDWQHTPIVTGRTQPP